MPLLVLCLPSRGGRGIRESPILAITLEIPNPCSSRRITEHRAAGAGPGAPCIILHIPIKCIAEPLVRRGKPQSIYI